MSRSRSTRPAQVPGGGRRMFVALRPPAEAVEQLVDFLEPRLDVGRAAGLRWSEPDQWHLTLAFADAVPDRCLDDLVENLADAVGRRRRFEVTLTGGGAFPHVAGARVLWLGLDLDAPARDELEALAAGARTAAARAGVRVDGQRFRPHLTLARAGRPVEVTPWVRLLDSYRGPAWTAEAVELVASHLGEGPRGRPRHDVLAEVALP